MYHNYVVEIGIIVQISIYTRLISVMKIKLEINANNAIKRMKRRTINSKIISISSNSHRMNE